MSVAIPLMTATVAEGDRSLRANRSGGVYRTGPYSRPPAGRRKVRCEYEKEYGGKPVIIILPHEAGNAGVRTAGRNILSLINGRYILPTGRRRQKTERQHGALSGRISALRHHTRHQRRGKNCGLITDQTTGIFESGEALRSASVKEEPSSPGRIEILHLTCDPMSIVCTHTVFP